MATDRRPGAAGASSIGGMFKREPAVILALVQAGIALIVSFGLDLSIEQTGAMLAVCAAILGVVTRSQVSPTGDT